MQKKGLINFLLNLVQKGVTKMKHTHTAFSYKKEKNLQITISAEKRTYVFITKLSAKRRNKNETQP